MAAVSSNFGGWLDVWYSVLFHECKRIMERQRELGEALYLKCMFESEKFSLKIHSDFRNVAPLNADLEILYP